MIIIREIVRALSQVIMAGLEMRVGLEMSALLKKCDFGEADRECAFSFGPRIRAAAAGCSSAHI